MSTTMKSIGDERLAANLTRLREQRGLSRAELEAMSGVSDISIYVAETRRRNLQVNTIRKLAEALGVSMGELLD